MIETDDTKIVQLSWRIDLAQQNQDRETADRLAQARENLEIRRDNLEKVERALSGMERKDRERRQLERRDAFAQRIGAKPLTFTEDQERLMGFRYHDPRTFTALGKKVEKPEPSKFAKRLLGIYDTPKWLQK